MRFVAGGVTASELSAFQAGLNFVNGQEFVHTKIETYERNEHVRLQAALRHAIGLETPDNISFIIVTCTLGTESGKKRKLVSDEDASVTWTVVDTHQSDAVAQAPLHVEPHT